MHFSGADITTSGLYQQWASQFNYQFDPTTLADPVKIKKKAKRENNGRGPSAGSDTCPTGAAGAAAGSGTGAGAKVGGAGSVLRPVHMMVGKDNAGLQSAFLGSTTYTRKLHSLFPSVFTPLSLLQRKGGCVVAGWLVGWLVGSDLSHIISFGDINCSCIACLLFVFINRCLTDIIFNISTCLLSKTNLYRNQCKCG